MVKRFVSIASGFLLLGEIFAHGQLVTNWIAYNDHRPGQPIPPHTPVQNSWGTALRATGYDMGAPADTVEATLTNFLDGQPLAATMTVKRTGSPDNFATVLPPLANTPAYRTFFGKVDLSNLGIVGVDAGITNATLTDSTIDYVTFTFNHLTPSKRYLFRGTSTRGGGYALRWSVATMLADGFVDAHESGPGSPGILTSNNYPSDLKAGQAAWNSGDNVEGDLVGWDFIAPFADGSISLVVSQYVGHTPMGIAADLNYGFSFGAILLAELEVNPPIIQTQPAAQTFVEQDRAFALSVTASGNALSYQWYRQGFGEIAGAKSQTYSVSHADLNDTGDYYVVVRNPLAQTTSTIAHVTVEMDVTPPSVATVFTYPTFDIDTQAAALNLVIIEFNEPIQASSATNVSQYTISSVGFPDAISVTGDRTVFLTLISPLAEDTAYTLVLAGVRDQYGNMLTTESKPFRSWMRSPANGLFFEAFNTAPATDLSTLTNHPNFPDHPFLRTNLWAFDTRIIFPDNSHESYGGRLRGVFIPPVSGAWVFFLRVYDRGAVYLNPAGLDAAGKLLVLQNEIGAEPRLWDKYISTPFHLRAGQAYYLEGLYQAANGTDVMKVAARLSGTGVPMPIDTPNTQIDSNALLGASIAFPFAPRDLGGPLTLGQDLADVTVAENQPATFSVVVSNQFGLPVLYEWTRNGVVIAGATGPSYTFTATAADHHANYQVIAAKMGSDPIASRVAQLSVTTDGERPRLTISRSGSQVVLSWSDPAFFLERAASANGPWFGITGASSPYPTNLGEGEEYYRLIKP